MQYMVTMVGMESSRFLAAVASLSTPAKTVNNFSGVFSLFNESLTPGRALAAAHPQTELTIKTAVSLF